MTLAYDLDFQSKASYRITIRIHIQKLGFKGQSVSKDRVETNRRMIRRTAATNCLPSSLTRSVIVQCVSSWRNKLKFNGTDRCLRSILVTSSRDCPKQVRNKSGMSGDFPVQLATRLPDWSAGGLLRCSAARLSVCRRRSPKSTSTTCCGHPREHATRMLRGKLVP